MPAASFSYDATLLPFSRSPRRPDHDLSVLQPTRQSAAGVRFGYTHTIATDTIRLQLRLSGSERTALEAFFSTVVSGMARAFTYTDTAGIAVTARFAKPELTLQETAYGVHEGTVELLVLNP